MQVPLRDIIFILNTKFLIHLASAKTPAFHANVFYQVHPLDYRYQDWDGVCHTFFHHHFPVYRFSFLYDSFIHIYIMYVSHCIHFTQVHVCMYTYTGIVQYFISRFLLMSAQCPTHSIHLCTGVEYSYALFSYQHNSILCFLLYWSHHTHMYKICMAHDDSVVLPLIDISWIYNFYLVYF